MSESAASACICGHALSDHNKMTEGLPCCDLCKCAGFRRGEWMLLAGESVCGPFQTLSMAKRYVEENDV